MKRFKGRLRNALEGQVSSPRSVTAAVEEILAGWQEAEDQAAPDQGVDAGPN